MSTVLITGATRGLGLATARAARAHGANVICAGRDEATTHAVAERLGATPVLLDLGSIAGVRSTAAQLPAVDAVVCNAGLQLLRGLSFTPDGFEETFQVNHLAHLALLDVLFSRPEPPRQAVLIGSGTHDPAVNSGTPNPPDDDDPISLARPEPDTDGALKSGLRRYATAKLLAAALAPALAREHPAAHITCFDPGLMAGTGLARQFPPAVRVLWNTLFKATSVLPFASTPARSGRAMATLLCEQPPTTPSGAYVDHRLRVVPASVRARDVAYQDLVLHHSRDLLAGIRG